VVGVQPFGGEGLSGTGPKAGGPLYLHRFVARTADDAAMRELRALDPSVRPGRQEGLEALAAWCAKEFPTVASVCARLREITPAHATVALPGPTGESNSYSVWARRSTLCLADAADALLMQTAAVLSVDGHAAWTESPSNRALHAGLPDAVRGCVELCADWRAGDSGIDAVLHTGDAAQREQITLAIAAREGPIVGVHAFDPSAGAIHLERLLVERVVSVNTAAAGGNASLMTMG
jgi:Delta 1-pyrroline-5-carboxylate dehydrogenase